VAFLSGSLRQGRIGIGYAALQAAKPEHAADAPTLELDALDAALQRLANATGKGSAREKERILGDLFNRGTAEEQEFLLRLLMGELRQGALEGLVTEAVARAAGLDGETVRRATMLAADPGSRRPGRPYPGSGRPHERSRGAVPPDPADAGPACR